MLKPDGEILTEITREAGSRGEIRTTILSNPKVDDRVDDEFVITLTPSDDRPHLDEPSRVQELRHSVAELEIDAVEKVPLRRIVDDEELPDLDGIGISTSTWPGTQ